MRQSTACMIAAVICVIFASMSPVSGATSDKAALHQLIEENQNLRMDAEEMAFFLATHGYDAAPKDGCVVINIDGETYKISPD